MRRIQQKGGLASILLLISVLANAAIGAEAVRQQCLLSGVSWQFLGGASNAALPKIDSSELAAAPWRVVDVPHVFQTRAEFTNFTQGWYRKSFSVAPNLSGKRLYLVFEGAATIADVYVNGKHLGQHRGAYTRFVFDVTDGVKFSSDNELAVYVNNDPRNTTDCLPNRSGLYTVWGGLYRKVWLVATDPVHIDLQDYASPGVYITPRNVSANDADLSLSALVRNSSTLVQNVDVRAALLDPEGRVVSVFDQNTNIASEHCVMVSFEGRVNKPKLWAPGSPNLYRVKVEVLRAGHVVDEVTQSTGFRSLVFDKSSGRVTLNGHPIVLKGANLHQEIESKAAAMSDDDFRTNYAFMQDLGFNFIRLPHYPHAQLEYDLCDELGILCWAENGHSNFEKQDLPGPTADRITTEMVKQNYNHPSIAVWSVGNEAGQDVADREVPVVKALDSTRPVVVANMKSASADFHGINAYPGWYGGSDLWDFPKKGYVTETGAGGMTTIHCDYENAVAQHDKYEPEEFQQLLAEARFQSCIKENNGSIGMFAWWHARSDGRQI